MKEFILERSLMNVNSVASISAKRVTLGHTKKSTLNVHVLNVTYHVRLNVCFVSAIAEKLTKLISVQELKTTD